MKKAIEQHLATMRELETKVGKLINVVKRREQELIGLLTFYKERIGKEIDRVEAALKGDD